MSIPRVEELIVGVDPGHPPSLVVLSQNGDFLDQSYPNLFIKNVTVNRGGKKKTERYLNVTAVSNWLLGMQRCYGVNVNKKVTIAAEKVSIRKGEGTVSALKYAGCYYTLEGIAAGRGYKFEPISPKTWKRYYELTSDKKMSLALARKKWPSDSYRFRLMQDHNTAEAALIASYLIERGNKND